MSLDRHGAFILINGRVLEVANASLSFEQVAQMAGGPVDTITYRWSGDGKTLQQGTLVRKESVAVKPGMIFNTARTGAA